jgi:predicted Zn-ribbon and HTH transcriptional regulator
LEEILKNDKFKKISKETKLKIYDFNAMPAYLNKISKLLSFFIERINPQLFIQTLNISKLPPNIFLEYLSYFENMINQFNTSSMKINELLSSQPSPSKIEEINQNLELRITNIDENIKLLQQFPNPTISKQSNSHEKHIKRLIELSFQIQNEMFQIFLFGEVYDQIVKIPEFYKVSEEIIFALFDLNQIPIYLNQILTSISPFIQRINQQSFIQKFDIFKISFLFSEYLSYFDEIIVQFLQLNANSKRIIEFLSSQPSPSKIEEINQNLELRITNIDESIKLLQKFPNPIISQESKSHEKHVQRLIELSFQIQNDIFQSFSSYELYDQFIQMPGF